MSKLLYRVKSSQLGPAELDGKTLRYFQRENWRDYTLLVQDAYPDGTFILLVRKLTDPLANEAGKIGWEDISMDQNAVNHIERAGSSNSLRGVDFVVFDQSPQARQMCEQ
jgi:hypothetical protein